MELVKFDNYLVDGVYAGFDGYHVWLKCERLDDSGLLIRDHVIGLEPSVLKAVLRYDERKRTEAKIDNEQKS